MEIKTILLVSIAFNSVVIAIIGYLVHLARYDRKERQRRTVEQAKLNDSLKNMVEAQNKLLSVYRDKSF